MSRVTCPFQALAPGSDISSGDAPTLTGEARIVQLTERGCRATATIHDAAAEIERELAAELGADRLEAL